MTAPAPCPDWPVVYTGDPTCPEALDWTPEQQALYESMATAYLAMWTGYGTCPITVRPCRSDCDSFTTFWGSGPLTSGYAGRKSSRGFGWGPALINGQWYNLSCGHCGDDCSCGGGTASLRLPGPVDAVIEVIEHAVVLDPASYRVDNHALLVRLDGYGWPTCQDMTEPADGENAFTISYLRGTPVPPGGQVAAGALSCEMGKAAASDPSCQLPRRIQTIARQGVTMQFLDSMDDLDKGRTGIWLVDSWVASVVNSPRSGQVYSVDIPRPRQRVTTWP